MPKIKLTAKAVERLRADPSGRPTLYWDVTLRGFGVLVPSHVLLAMGCTPARARSSVRFSLGKYNTEAEVDYALRHLPGIIARLRAHAPAEAGKPARRATAQPA